MGYIYNRGQSAPGKRIYTWLRLVGKVYFDSFDNMDGARSNSN